MGTSDPFSRRLLEWFDREGRKDLPWQQGRDPYLIWVSEVMLQQTQVATVIPYFERFITRFPTLEALAVAPLDDVLSQWTGLGYYARARHLHRAAELALSEHGGTLPRTLEGLMSLPGIGRSTAGAILAFAYDERWPILDGNVKRVLARYHQIEGHAGLAEFERKLWAIAERHTPKTRVANYTQAIMDLGALICVRGKPECAACPVRGNCRARASGNPADYPAPRPRKARPTKRTRMVMITEPEGSVLLIKRPATGIWGGLWSFPECDVGEEVASWSRRVLGLEVAVDPPWGDVAHGFTHYRLDIEPWPCRLDGSPDGRVDRLGGVWYKLGSTNRLGLPAPVKTLLQRLESER